MKDVHLNCRQKHVKIFDSRCYKRYLSSNGKILIALASIGEGLKCEFLYEKQGGKVQLISP